MRSLLPCLLALLCVYPVWAQDDGPQGAKAVEWETAEFQRIEATRVRETAAMDAEEAACYKRFAVSSCLNGVQSRRRAMLANLRRQEATLHERQFAAQGAEQLRRNQQKARERAQQEADQRAETADGSRADRLQAQRDKQAEHTARKSTSAASAPALRAPLAGPTPAEQATNRENFARKQAEAQKKREDNARRQAEKGGKPAAPLPIPR
ncbi:hypothetical protein DIC66_00875 [Rhodoferax lacus]|uniref:Uncharacterized protein n=1 Tax=Rhodoferax lacus TaxID=2184758 RepID=A0A3E1RGH2_9BURK|nr:hypothetical protein [Rhodoferax lacus]RFO98477.1 hypothetical protein DIC66_00875 [Rhodoferax lacus]